MGILKAGYISLLQRKYCYPKVVYSSVESNRDNGDYSYRAVLLLERFLHRANRSDIQKRREQKKLTEILVRERYS